MDEAAKRHEASDTTPLHDETAATPDATAPPAPDAPSDANPAAQEGAGPAQTPVAPEVAATVEGADAAPPAPEDGPPPGEATAEVAAELDPVALLQERDRLAAEKDALQDRALRLRAEFDNYRKRTARELEQARTQAAEKLLQDLLPVLDHLELALAHATDEHGEFAKGVRLTATQFADALSKAGVTPIVATGERFDPELHEALAQQPSDEHPADTVVMEYQRGYRLGERVLRHARVVVSSGPGGDAAAGEAAAGPQGAENAAD